MLQIIGLVLPIFAIIGFGRLSMSRNILSSDGLAGLNGFTFWLALPALLFGSIAESHTSQLMGIGGIYLVSCIFIFTAAILVGCLLLDVPLTQAAVFGLNATYGNVIFLGMPLVTTFFGPQGLAQLLTIIAFHSGVLLPLAAVLMELGSGRMESLGAVMHRTVLGLARNPIIVSITLAFVWHITGLAVPGPVHNLFSMLGSAASPLALFCLGASLPPAAMEAKIIREATVATVLKLSVLPACVGSMAWLAGLSGLPWRVAVVTAAMPTGANAFMLARRATSFAEASASTVVVTTTISIISITGLLSWLQ